MVRKDPNNPNFIQAIVNNVTQYDGTTSGFGTLLIDAGSGQDEIDIQYVPANLAIETVERGASTVIVGKNGSLSGIQGYVDIVNPLDATAITLDDSADAANTTATIDHGGIYDLTPFPIAFSQADVSSLTIKGGTGQDIYNVDSTPNPGPDPIATTTIISGGYATVNIGKLGSAQGILGDLFIENPLYSTAVAIDDSADQQGRYVTLTQQASNLYSLTGMTPATVYYLGSRMSSVVLAGGSGNDAIAIGPSVDGIGLMTVSGGGGNNSLKIDDSQGTGLPTDLPDNAANVQSSIAYTVTSQDVSRTAGYGYSLPNGGGGGVSFTNVAYSGMASLELDGSDIGAAVSVTGAASPDRGQRRNRQRCFHARSVDG